VTQYTELLFETIIITFTKSGGQRSALAFFGAGVVGIETARRSARTFRDAPRHPDLSVGLYFLGGPDAINDTRIDLSSYSRESWVFEERAKRASTDWFRQNRGAFIDAVDGDPSHLIASSILLTSAMDFCAHGSHRIIAENMRGLSGNFRAFFMFNGMPDVLTWIARETISATLGALLWPTSEFMLRNYRPEHNHEEMKAADVFRFANLLETEVEWRCA
jgi:hypothetical protein